MAGSFRSFDRRAALFGGVTALGAAMLPTRALHAALAQDANDSSNAQPEPAGERKRELLKSYGFVWSATSPSIHEGDVFELTVTNRGSALIKLLPFVTIMDHTKHLTFPVIDEAVELAPGVVRTFSATNDYGVANHFSTSMFVDTGDVSLLGIVATIHDVSGAETTSFNERAFWIKSRADIEAIAESKKDAEMEGGHHGGHRPQQEADRT